MLMFMKCKCKCGSQTPGVLQRALPHYYGMELHNFNPNSITQAAIFVALYEGYLGIAPHWELWLHLFRAGHTTKPTGTSGTRKAVRAGGCTLQVR